MPIDPSAPKMPFEGVVQSSSAQTAAGDVLLRVRLLEQDRVLAEHLEEVHFSIMADGQALMVDPTDAQVLGAKVLHGTLESLQERAPELAPDLALLAKVELDPNAEFTLEIARLRPRDRVKVYLVDIKTRPAKSVRGRALAIGYGKAGIEDWNTWYQRSVGTKSIRKPRASPAREGVPERFVARVLGEGTVLHNVTLTLSRHEQRSSVGLCSFLVELQDGQTLQVHTTKQTQIGPAQARKARWQELADDPLAAPFSHSAPGGHVKVGLAGVLVAAGDTITIRGVIERPSAVHADLIGVGEQAGEWIDAGVDARASIKQAAGERRSAVQDQRARYNDQRERGRTEGSELSIVGAALVLIAGLASLAYGLFLSATAAEGPWVRVAFALGLLVTGLGLYLWRRRRFTPRMDHGDWQSGGMLWSVRPWASHLMGWGVPATLVLIVAGMGEAAYVVPMFVLLVEGLVLHRETGKHARALRTIQASAYVDGDGWGARGGTVVTGELERSLSHTRTTTTHATTSHVETTAGGYATVHGTTDITDYNSSGSGGTGSLKVQIGERVIDVVVTKLARWGSTRRYIQNRTLTELIRPGDPLILVGRIEADQMKATGPDSLFIFASHRGAPHVTLLRALAGHWLGLLGFAALIAAAIVLTIKEIAL